MKVTLLTVVALTTVVLCSAADPECRYRKVRKLALHWADPTDCARYYRCTNKNIKRAVICAEGRVYNAKTGKCSTNRKGLCKLPLPEPLDRATNPCADKVSGAYIPQPGYCRNFYICNNNQAYLQACDAGSRFNATTSNCIPDTGSECWQNKCVGEADGSYLPDASSCASFYVCASGEVTQQDCSNGSYFNSSIGVCQPDPNGEHCWENLCVGKPDGDFVKDVNDCHSYYVCTAGKPVKQECPEGSYFDWTQNVCIPGECPSDESSTACTEASTESSSSTECIEVTTAATKCPETTTPTSEAGCACPGGYKEGELVPFPNYPENCSKYYECLDGKLEEKECGIGNLFDSSLGVCVPDTDHTCWPTTECPETTTPASEVGCTCPGGYKEGELVPFPNYPENCSKYYECLDGKLEEKECGVGNLFDSSLGVCVPDTDHTCWPTTECPETTTPASEVGCTCPGGYKEGELVPFPNYPENCSKYYECLDGKLEEKECGVGNLFDSSLGVCVPDTDHTCWPTTECPETTTPASEVGCTCPGGYKEGELVPFPNYPENCSKYYECLDGKLEEKECGIGNLFDSSLGVCVPDTDHTCWPTTECPETTTPASEVGSTCPGGYKEGELVPFPNYPENCSKYYECLDGKLEEKECGVGNLFDSSLGVCVPDTDHTCWPTTECPETTTPASEVGCTCPGGYKEGELVPFPNYPENCSKYYECMDGKLEEKECGVGNLFDSSLGVCVPDTDHTCWPTTECPETTTPASEVGCTCPGGYKEGELVPFPNYPENCSKYYECLDGKLEEKECGVGNLFDSSLGVCVPDTDHTCWPTTECPETTTPASEVGCTCPGGYKEGELVPFPNYPENCSKYYECLDGKLEEKECGIGNLFDSSLGVCVPDTDHTCWPTTECPETTTPASEVGSTCPGGYKEGELVPFPNYPENCSKYYECLDGKLEEKECGVGNLFDSSLGVCVPDTDHTCWPTTECPETTTPASEVGCTCPGGYKEGELVPFPNYPENCSKYYECLDGKLEEKECGIGNLFDSSLGVCVPDTDHICSPADCNDQEVSVRSRRSLGEDVATELAESDCTCPGGYNEGELLPFPGNCSKYYVCTGGKLQEYDCGVGNRFDSSLGVCVPDTDNVCWPAETNCTCPGGYNEGELLPFPGNCSKYYVCTGGKLQEYDCGVGNRFDSSLGVCVPDTDNVCWPAETNCTCPGGYNEGELLPFPGNCSKYYVCTGGKLQEYDCGVGNRFDSSLGVCVPDTDNICWPAETNCTCPGGYKEGQLLPLPNCPENCNKYYICTGGKLQERDCGYGNRFDSSIGVCVPDTDNTCWPNVCKGQLNGTAVVDPTNCTSFYLCEGGQGEVYECPPDKWFNPIQQICVPDFNAACINPCKDTTGIKFLPSPDCTKYFLCNDGQPFVETCAKGGFDINLGKCSEDAVCETTLCLGREDGTTFPTAGNDNEFYLCLGAVAQVNECPLGTTFQASVGVCLEQPSPSCDQTKCNSSQPEYNAFAPLTDTDDTAFCLCRNGEAFLHHCTDSYTFRADLEICYSNAPCDPELCDVYPENTRSLNHNDTQSFCLCVSREPVIVGCPNNQTYNPVSQLCQTHDSKCSSTFCSSAPEYTILPALNNDIDGFCICLSSGTEYKLCDGGNKFDVDRGICLTTTARTEVCSDALCGGNEGLIFGVTGDPHSFCYCGEGGVAIQNSCPNSEIFNETLLICQAVGCDGQFCLTNPSGPFPALNEPYSFCMCASTDPSSVTKYNCENGTYFDAYFLICLEEPCDKSFCCSPSNDGVSYPANNYPQGFCICNGSSPQLHSCPSGAIFDPTTNICTSPINVECDLSQCANATSENTYAVAAKNDPHGFCYCFSSTEVDFFTCPDDALFNPNLGICAVNGPDIPGTPVDNCTCPGGYEEGQVLPNPTNCRLYYVCSHGRLQEFDCGAGKYFDQLSAECQVDTCGSCVETAALTCVGTYREGEFVAHRTNNQLFYLCHNARLTEGDCGPGNFFDKNSFSCQPLDKNQQGTIKHLMRSEAIPEDDNLCVENEKHSVPSNCSQYEICLDGIWTRLSCPNEWYYNPEQSRCVEPLDDTICAYARVKNLPVCNSTMEQRTVPGKESYCAQYYRCSRGKWHFKNCPKQHFYSRRLKTCITSSYDDACAARNQTGIDNEIGQYPRLSKCRHMAVRHSEKNCAMYLMCMEDKWWHQYCPLGMYYNRTHNYCMPNTDGQCADANLHQEYSMQPCDLQGALRPSALSCDRYHECQAGFWESRKCGAHQYFNDTEGACLPDIEGVCAQLHTANCAEGERREFPLNCTAYEICTRGEWQRTSCNHSMMFDNILHTCVPNDGSCADNGLRIVCAVGETRAHPLAEYCTEFYYCLQDSWNAATCLKGDTYANELGGCVPHGAHDQCQPLYVEETVNIGPSKDISDQTQFENNRSAICLGREDGSVVTHPHSCLHFFVCIAEVATSEQKCVRGSFFDAKLGYCRPNDGSCRIPLSGLCANTTDGGYVPHPEDCQAYYHCSTLNGIELLRCAEGEYYHNTSGQCQIDLGECRSNAVEFGKCSGAAHGKRLPHERYCNIYYACVRGLAIPAVCPADHHFRADVGHCLFDGNHSCENGILSEATNNVTTSYTCDNLTDGIHLPDTADCTKYYVCSAGVALTKNCPMNAFFDSEQRLCVPDDGSCPYIKRNQPSPQPAPPHPAICEGKHGHMMADPANCNEFYVCINGKLRHERCDTSSYFTTSINQCQSYQQAIGNGTTTESDAVNDNGSTMQIIQNVLKCNDKPTNYTQLCSQIPQGTSVAEQGDCRRYINCNDAGEPVSQRCRNGESYDSLLGFCRQNDGTCLMENGQRVGECNGRHGQLVRVADNCRGYFVCINGQKIAGECEKSEYFDKMLSKCVEDENNQCGVGAAQPTATQAVSCVGLSDSILYPFTPDNCRSYFQCVHGTPNVHECADGLYFNATLTRCVKDISECVMPAINLKRAPELVNLTNDICENAIPGQRYANIGDNCHSFYVCEGDGSIIYTNCPTDELYSSESGACVNASKVICKL